MKILVLKSFISMLMFYVSIGYSSVSSNKDSLVNEAWEFLKKAEISRGDDKKSIIYFRSAINEAMKVDQYEILELSHRKIASLLFRKRKYLKAIEEYNKAILFGTKNGSNSIINWKIYIAECRYALAEFNSCLDSLTIIEEISNRKTNKRIIR